MQPLFGTPESDSEFEEGVAVFHEALISKIEADYPEGSLPAVIDVGCHRGGLLERIIKRWRPKTVYGIEPLADARSRASKRLRVLGVKPILLRPEYWHKIPEDNFNLITCHEVVYLIEDLKGFIGNIARVLNRGGSAYLTLGCHVENPLWPIWRPVLEEMGYKTYGHSPLDILRTAESFRLIPAVQPLRHEGWIVYAPTASLLPFPSVTAMLDHHFTHKLLFRLTKP